MSDLISRADALQCKPEFLNPNPNDNPNNYLIGWNDAIKAWYAEINALPSADAVSFEDAMEIRNTILFKEYMRGRRDAVQGWIPIKDGLPKLYKDVMATVWFEDDGDDDDAFEIAFGFLDKFGKWDLRLADGCECIKGFYVQAWQPLPTLYKGGDDECV